MHLPRRRFMQLGAGIAALPALPRLARAQAYPTRSVTLIVPFAAGGPTDVCARIVGDHMSRTLGQQFVVENVVGAGGTTGSTRAMRAAPMVTPFRWARLERMRVRCALSEPGYRPDM
jgi:tripartite-type tricarboxylate transporter receptor subunit TctC